MKMDMASSIFEDGQGIGGFQLASMASLVPTARSCASAAIYILATNRGRYYQRERKDEVNRLLYVSRCAPVDYPSFSCVGICARFDVLG